MFTINAVIRKYQGKGESRRLRRANKFPAIVYGGTEAPIAIALDHDIILNTQFKEDFYADVLDLLIDNKRSKVRVQAVQRHPCKPKLIHIDFVRA